jgi:hypothetical protein
MSYDYQEQPSKEKCFRDDCDNFGDERFHNRRNLIICSECHQRLYTKCPECWVSVWDEYFHGYANSCNECARDNGYVSCSSCGEDCHEDDLTGQGTCGDCYDYEYDDHGAEHGLEGLVGDYHSGARWLDSNYPEQGNYFRGSSASEIQISNCKTDPNTYFGIEFEFEDPDPDMRPALERIIEQQIGHVETDGSLNEGLELITRPADFEAWHGLFGHEFAQARSSIKAFGGNFAGPKVGQHIHVSRAAFSNVGHLARAVIFHQFNGEYIFHLSGKTRDNFERYSHVNKYAPSVNRHGLNRSELRTALKNRRDDRSRALNLTKEHSVEFRFWGGSNLDSDVISTVQWCHALIEYLRTMNSGEAIAGGLLSHSFHEFLVQSVEYSGALDMVNRRVPAHLRE